MYSLKLLDGASIQGPDGPITGRAAQRHRLALLALLAAAPRGGLTRDKLVAYLWPERARRPLLRSHALSPTADTRKDHVAVLLGYAPWRGGVRGRARELFDEFERFATGQIESGSE